MRRAQDILRLLLYQSTQPRRPCSRQQPPTAIATKRPIIKRRNSSHDFPLQGIHQLPVSVFPPPVDPKRERRFTL